MTQLNGHLDDKSELKSSHEQHLSTVLDRSWRKRDGPNQWTIDTTLAFHHIRESNSSVTQEDLQKCLINVFIDRMVLGPTASSFLLRYLQHALATSFISIHAFCQELFSRVKNDSAIFENASVIHDYLSVIELMIPHLTSSELLRSVKATTVATGTTSDHYLKTVTVDFQQLNNSDHSSAMNGGKEKKGVKRKREEISNESITYGTDEDTQQTTKKTKLSHENFIADVQLHKLTDIVNIVSYILIRFLVQSIEAYAEHNEKKADSSIDILSGVFEHYSNEVIISSVIQCAKSLSKIFVNQKTQFLISISKEIDSEKWLLLKQTLKDDYLRVFDQTLFNTEVLPTSTILHSKSAKENLINLWKSGLQLFCFLAKSDDTSAYDPQDFMTGSNLNLKSFASNALSLVINEEIFSNDLQRTRLHNSFRILDQLRQLKRLNITNFILELMVSTLRMMQSVPTKNDPTSLDFVEQHNQNTLNLYKSFFLSKLPLLFKEWNEKYSKDKEFYDLFMKRTSKETDGVSLSHIEKSLKLLKKFPTLYILPNGENLLLQITGSCIDLKLVNEENMVHMFPENPVVPSLDQDPQTLIEKFAVSQDFNELSEIILYFRLHYALVEKMVENVSKPEYCDLALHFICLNPSLLDIIHIHGRSEELLENLFAACHSLFENYRDTKDSDQDQVALMNKLHDQFSQVFCVMFLVVQRYRVINIADSRTRFLELMHTRMATEDVEVSHSLKQIKNWIYGWFHDLDMLPVADASSKGKGVSPCPIGDELLAALLDLQTQQLLLETQTDSQQTLNFDKLQDIKTRYLPSQILEITPYIVEQCQYVYSEKGMNVLVSTQMLGFFVSFFGKYCDISVAVSLKNSLHRVFTKADSPENTNAVLLVTQLYSGNLWSAPQFGYNMGSSIIHNTLQSSVHFVNKHIQDTDIEPIIRNYSPLEQTGAFFQKLLQDEYTTTRKTLKYQLSHTTPPISMPDAPSDFISIESILLPNTNHKLGNELHELTTPIPEAASHQRAFERAFYSLLVHKKLPNTPSLVIGSHSHMNFTIAECFEILQSVLRFGGMRQFIHFIVDAVIDSIQKEEESVAEPVFVAEIGALVLGIIGGRSVVQYYFQMFLPSFLHNWMELNKARHASSAKSNMTTMQRMMRLHHYHQTAQIFAYFSVVVSFYHNGSILEESLSKLSTHYLVAPKLLSKDLITLYFLVQTLELCSSIPSIATKFSIDSVVQFARIGSRFNSVDSIHSFGTPEDQETNAPPLWVLSLFNQKDATTRARCLQFYSVRS